MHDFLTFLKKRLKGKLPGREAQLKMAPQPVGEGELRQMEAPKNATRSSVLVLMFPNKDNKLELILTLRADDINHGGQISFPGGRAEENESLSETALREAWEEIGVEPQKVEIIGYLSELFVAHSNNRVAPVAAFLDKRPTFDINPAEVEEIFAIELDFLLHKKNLTVEDWNLEKDTYRVPYWNVHRVPLWGATAMMLSELLDLYREFLEE